MRRIRTVDSGGVCRVEISIDRSHDVSTDPEGDLTTVADDGVGDLLSRNNLGNILRGSAWISVGDVSRTLEFERSVRRAR